ncbi:MAG: DUF2017 family protein [Acidimicrobiia bacterium]|nr:DUF2017 family protein [Acidimicrobiia bacterium]
MTESFAPSAGGVRMELAEWQVTLLGKIPNMLAEARDDPSFPTSAYPDDEHADAEFRRLMAAEWAQARSLDRAIVERTLKVAGGGVVLSMPEADAWMRVLGEARLLIAARLGIEEPGWDRDGAIEESPDLALLHYLSWMHGGLVDVLSDLIPT